MYKNKNLNSIVFVVSFIVYPNHTQRILTNQNPRRIRRYHSAYSIQNFIRHGGGYANCISRPSGHQKEIFTGGSLWIIKKSILHGKLKARQGLIEEQLAHQVGISRTPVREAFHKLERDELVTRLPKGAFCGKGIYWRGRAGNFWHSKCSRKLCGLFDHPSYPSR